MNSNLRNILISFMLNGDSYQTTIQDPSNTNITEVILDGKKCEIIEIEFVSGYDGRRLLKNGIEVFNKIKFY